MIQRGTSMSQDEGMAADELVGLDLNDWHT